MDRASLLFCTLSLALSLLISILFFPLATLTQKELEASRLPVPAEEMGDLDLGDFGSVSVPELVDYYLENPPDRSGDEAPVRKVRFQGC
ncbi:MAG: hypothetical protein KDI83_13200 [Gammaproteobacteria bacterium]|nr:hypothetical protein [Gammaproteobacteria bacterium]